MEKEEKENSFDDYVYDDWFEFRSAKFPNSDKSIFVNLKRTEISEVRQCENPKEYPNMNWCIIVMRNGNEYCVNSTYDEVMKKL